MKELLKALHAAQADMEDPIKQSTNPAFKSKYADINSVLEAIREPLQKHGLVVTQTYRVGSDGQGAVLVTVLWHAESGESLKSEAPLNPAQNTPQGIGAATTYYRRFSLSAMFGLGAQDDDGNEASSTSSGAPADAMEALAKRSIDALAKAKSESEIARILTFASNLPTKHKSNVDTAAEQARKRVK